LLRSAFGLAHSYRSISALSLVLVCIMMRGVWPLLIESALILLQTVPTHIDVDVLKEKLLRNIDGILAVHDFHVWQLTSDRIIASAHIRCLNLGEYMKVAENIKEFFHNEGIHSTTIQPEFVDYPHPVDTEDCVLSCPKGPGSIPVPACEASKCCLPASASNGNGAVQKRSSRSAQNTPVTSRRPQSFHEQPPEVVDDQTPLHAASHDGLHDLQPRDEDKLSATSW
jgi:hypothetical protein